MTTATRPLSEILKDEVIATQPNGIWLVLAEESPQDCVTAEDLVAGGDGATAPGPLP